MGIFSNTTKIINSKDYEILSNRIADLAAQIAVLKTELTAQHSLINSMNGRINRKLNPETQEETIKGGLPFPFGAGA
jgi:transcriptional regulator CtsR